MILRKCCFVKLRIYNAMSKHPKWFISYQKTSKPLHYLIQNNIQQKKSFQHDDKCYLVLWKYLIDGIYPSIVRIQFLYV